MAGCRPGVVNVVPASRRRRRPAARAPRRREDPLHRLRRDRTARDARGRRERHPFVLELGGKDAAVVAADADLERTASGLVWGAFANAGQACGSIERVYVVREVADELVSRVVEKTRRLRQGDPLAEGTDLGPMTTAEQRDFVDAQVREAVAQGARALTGGERPPRRGTGSRRRCSPTSTHGMRVMTEETFGPVLPIAVVDSLDEAIALANDSEFGLTASGWTRSTRTARKLVEELRAGTVTINDHLFSFGSRRPPGGASGSRGSGGATASTASGSS
jgi:NAD-dependent aldehyde dehydrogenases